MSQKDNLSQKEGLSGIFWEHILSFGISCYVQGYLLGASDVLNKKDTQKILPELRKIAKENILELIQEK